MKTDKQLLPIRDAARLLYVDISTLRRWGDEGLIRAYRIGPRSDRRFWNYDILNLKAYLQSNNGNPNGNPEGRKQ